MRIAVAILALSMSSAGGAASAGMQVCTADPAAIRMSPEQAAARARLMGYKVVNVEVDQGCWRLDVLNDRGKKYVLRLHAGSGELMARFEPGRIDAGLTASTD